MLRYILLIEKELIYRHFLLVLCAVLNGSLASLFLDPFRSSADLSLPLHA